jgi:hypothetical protein
MHISICAYAASEPFATFTIDIAFRGDFRNTKPKAVILGEVRHVLRGSGGRLIKVLAITISGNTCVTNATIANKLV